LNCYRVFHSTSAYRGFAWFVGTIEREANILKTHWTATR